MEKFEGTISEWLNLISSSRKGYLKKKRSWAYDVVWWEDDKDKWFLNWAMNKGKGNISESVWVTAKDAPSHVTYAMGEGKEMYIDKEE